MFQWRREVIVEKPVLLVSTDNRLRGDKWNDAEYLKAVRDMQRNNVFITEAVHCLEVLRDKADGATTPDELKGYREAISAVKELIFAPINAQRRLIEINEEMEMQKEQQI